METHHQISKLNFQIPKCDKTMMTNNKNDKYNRNSTYDND